MDLLCACRSAIPTSALDISRDHTHHSSMEEAGPANRSTLAQSQRALVMLAFFVNGMPVVPEMNSDGDEHANADADEEEPAIRREPYQRDSDDGRGDDKSGTASDADGHAISLLDAQANEGDSREPLSELA